MEYAWLDRDEEDLQRAVELLESPSFVARLADLIGIPVEALFKALPATTSGKIMSVVDTSLRKTLDVAVRTLDARGGPRPARNLTHKLAVGFSGGVGGAFGIAALGAELPVSTTLMLRSIADIARSEGEDLGSVASQLECLSVFALGGRTQDDDAAESGYFTARAGLAVAVRDAAQYIARRGLADASAPPIARLIARISARFGGVVAEKIAAHGVPIVGAIGGATINVLFMDHFQDVARGHFTIRRLERAYGPEPVAARYEEIRRRLESVGD